MSQMTADDVVHAWKDEQFRSSLPEEVQSALPAAPDDMGVLSDDELKQAAGGGIEINDVINITIDNPFA